MRVIRRYRKCFIAAVAGGCLLAPTLSTAVAFADDFAFAPDTSTFDPTQVEGYPPLDNVVTGTESFSLDDLTQNSVNWADAFTGVDTETTVGSFTNDDFLDTGLGIILLNSSSTEVLDIPTGTQIDLANFGGGWENEWVSVPTGIDAGTSDLLITPFGDFPMLGSLFADLTAAL